MTDPGHVGSADVAPPPFIILKRRSGKGSGHPLSELGRAPAGLLRKMLPAYGGQESDCISPLREHSLRG